jgi:predicted  nucleic acid-binding Zn-ribbon protein
MHPDLSKLLDLQAKDTAIAEMDARIAAVDADVATLDHDLDRARGARDTAQRAAADGARRRDELEAKIESFRQLQERRRQRLEFVRNPKEASTLMAEMDLARSVLAKEEGDWVRSADSVEALRGRVGEEEAKVVGVEAEQQARRTELAERRAQLQVERDGLVRRREEAASLLERTLRIRYERLRKARASVVVVALSGDACGACFTAVPRNRRSQIRSGALLEGCEACGVILYAAES